MSGYYKQRVGVYSRSYGLEFTPGDTWKQQCEIFFRDNYTGDEEARGITPEEAERLVHLLQNYLMAHAAYTEGRTP